MHKKIYLLLLAMIFSAGMLFAQQTITGTVIAADDQQPIPGASVKINNSTVSTFTDMNGKFSIKAKPTDILVFSFVGFTRKNVTVGQQKIIDVTLAVEATSLNEVVVVGYGTQKKVNLTGAVQTLRLDSAVNIPVTNAAQLMYGKFSGVQLTQGNGLAGDDGSTINIRGLGTFGNIDPLVVIDGMQFEGLAEFNRLAPSDIETITVLKDASAGAIYGARGANGVIVVTTKQGNSETFKVEYNNYVGKSSPTVVPKFLEAYDYAILMNEYYKNQAGGGAFNPRYSDADLQLILSESDPFKFANSNWAKASLKDAVVQNHFLALSGGKGNTKFRLSIGYLNQDAIVKGDYEVNRYNFRANLNSDLRKWFVIGNNLNGNFQKTLAPTGGLGTVNDIIAGFSRNAPTIPIYNANGGPGFADGAAFRAINPSKTLESNFVRTGFNGEYTNNDIDLSNRSFFRVNFIKNLSLEGALTLSSDISNVSDFKPTNIDADDLEAVTSVNKLTKRNVFNYKVLAESLLRYNGKYKKSAFNALLGYSTIYAKNSNFDASLSQFISNSLQEFDAGGILNPIINGSASETAILSVFGRLNYNYDGKYLLELNVRRDGSSKFSPKDYGYATFPSISAGWRISEEEFLKDNKYISNLKLRGSWGRTGNNGIPNYGYRQTYNAGLDYILGTTPTLVSGVAVTNLASPNIRWETNEQYDLGIDAAFFKNKLTVEVDYFNRKTKDILYANFPIPATLGVTTLVAVNSASMLNRGLELNTNYIHNKPKGFSYTISANITKNAKNRVLDLGSGTPTVGASSVIRAGDPFNAYFGWKAIGIFQTADEVTNSPVQFGVIGTKPGDIKYADLGGPAGIPDGVIDNFDRTVIGNPYPIWLYGFNASTNYKSWGLSIGLQGVGNVDRLLKLGGIEPFPDERTNALSYWINRWTPTNPSTTLPRVGGVNNTINSTFYIQDASYLRLRNVEISYQIPKTYLNKFKLSGMKIFASGQNLLTFTKMKNYDPERNNESTSARIVPLYKVYTMGLNFTL